MLKLRRGLPKTLRNLCSQIEIGLALLSWSVALTFPSDLLQEMSSASPGGLD